MIVLLLLLSQMQTVSKFAHQNNTTTYLYLKSIKLQSSPPINPIFGMYTIQNRKSYQSGHVVTIVNTYTIVIENQDLYNPNCKTSKAIIKHRDIKKKTLQWKSKPWEKDLTGWEKSIQSFKVSPLVKLLTEEAGHPSILPKYSKKK